MNPIRYGTVKKSMTPLLGQRQNSQQPTANSGGLLNIIKNQIHQFLLIFVLLFSSFPTTTEAKIKSYNGNKVIVSAEIDAKAGLTPVSSEIQIENDNMATEFGALAPRYGIGTAADNKHSDFSPLNDNDLTGNKLVVISSHGIQVKDQLTFVQRSKISDAIKKKDSQAFLFFVDDYSGASEMTSYKNTFLSSITDALPDGGKLTHSNIYNTSSTIDLNTSSPYQASFSKMFTYTDNFGGSVTRNASSLAVRNGYHLQGSLANNYQLYSGESSNDTAFVMLNSYDTFLPDSVAHQESGSGPCIFISSNPGIFAEGKYNANVGKLKHAIDDSLKPDGACYYRPPGFVTARADHFQGKFDTVEESQLTVLQGTTVSLTKLLANDHLQGGSHSDLKIVGFSENYKTVFSPTLNFNFEGNEGGTITITDGDSDDSTVQYTAPAVTGDRRVSVYYKVCNSNETFCGVASVTIDVLENDYETIIQNDHYDGRNNTIDPISFILPMVAKPGFGGGYFNRKEISTLLDNDQVYKEGALLSSDDGEYKINGISSILAPDAFETEYKDDINLSAAKIYVTLDSEKTAVVIGYEKPGTYVLYYKACVYLNDAQVEIPESGSCGIGQFTFIVSEKSVSDFIPYNVIANDDLYDDPASSPLPDIAYNSKYIALQGGYLSSNPNPNPNHLIINDSAVADDDSGATSLLKVTEIGDQLDNLQSISTVSYISTQQGGTVRFYMNGKVDYKPANDFIGEDIFYYKVCAVNDPSFCHTAKVKLNVKAPFDVIPQADHYDGSHNTAFPSDLIVDYGSINNLFANLHGNDSVVPSYSDGFTMLRITGVGTESTAFDDPDATINMALTANGGRVKVTDAGVEFTPANIEGVDSFFYKVCAAKDDGTISDKICGVAKVTVNVIIPVAVTAQDDHHSGSSNTVSPEQLTVEYGSIFKALTDLIINDSATPHSSSTDSYSLRIVGIGGSESTIVTGITATTAVSSAQSGEIQLNASFDIEYQPPAGYTGEDTFYYQVCAIKNNAALTNYCAIALVTVDVIKLEAQITGTVFNDNQLAHNGIQNDNETGLAGRIVTLRQGSKEIFSTTKGDGSFTFNLDPSWLDSDVTITVAVPNSWLAISESWQKEGTSTVATVGDAIDSQTKIEQADLSKGRHYFFGQVKEPTLTESQTKEGESGDKVYFSHQLTFFTHSAAIMSIEQINLDWETKIYQDQTCNQQLDDSDITISFPSFIDAEAGEKICLLIEVTIPGGFDRIDNDQYIYDLKAEHSFFDPGTGHDRKYADKNQDIVRLGPSAGRLTLKQWVKNITKGEDYTTVNAAEPGEILEYKIVFSNQSSKKVSDIDVYDYVPDFSQLESPVTCGDNAFLPCVVILPDPSGGKNQQGYLGKVQWRMTGDLMPGKSGFVTYRVQVDP
ncbi:Ig-like domain-containing protein [Vibrio sp. SS-MA-C1-2]|uniref:Ig-like domain-containing protein n=1 Tax=Vibrio sp. SS-MA-C1-2 TaxID=2908646 RepID=UPI001F3188D1|nr:Ig-like domain-containing protein [Vibrio sp. SS-MA-C1-2]UJF17724.1 Ig-like domain-containing protein [Vibrio sp. SS-MA-C1-2]